MAESESDEEATKTHRVMVQTYDDGYRAGYEAARAQAAEVAETALVGRYEHGPSVGVARRYIKAAILAMEPRDNA